MTLCPEVNASSFGDTPEGALISPQEVAPKHKEVVIVDHLGSKENRVLQKKPGRDVCRAHERQENTSDRQRNGPQTLAHAGK